MEARAEAVNSSEVLGEQHKGTGFCCFKYQLSLKF